MTELKQNKFDELVVPIYFYCTFMEGFGQQEVVERGHLSFMDDRYRIDINEARSPSDILWLNRDVSKRTARIGGGFMVLVVTLFILSSGYIFILAMSVQNYILYRTNPPNVNCNAMNTVHSETEM